MTNPDPRGSRRRLRSGLLALALGPVAVLAACGSEAEEVVEAPPPPPPPAPVAPPAPRVTPIDDLMVRLGIDGRVWFPEDRAPDNDPERIALLELFDGFVRADESAVSPKLVALDRMELERLADSDDWENAADAVEEVEVVTGRSPDGDLAVLGFYSTADGVQPQLWYYRQEGADFVFESVQAPLNVMDRLYGDEPIKIWHELLAEDDEYGRAEDIAIEVVQRDLTDPDGENLPSAPSAGGGSRPSAAPGGGGRKPPIPPRRPPGPGS